jgi:hypothetical protein
MAGVTECKVPGDPMKTKDNCSRVLDVAVLVERVIQSAHKIRLIPHVNVLAHQFVQSHGRGVHFPAIPLTSASAIRDIKS